jgi:putative heme iron utilization protein
VLATINFAELALGEARHPAPSLRAATTKDMIEHAYATMIQAQERGATVRAALGEAHAGLRTLAQLNATLAKKIR